MNEKRCECCGDSFESEHLKRKYCSSSCAAKINNKKYPKRSLSKKCKFCGVNIPSNYTFCSEHGGENYKETQRMIKVKEWLSGDWNGGGLSLSDYIRSYLLEKADYKCTKCGFDTPHPDDGKTILEINHIDGNGTNHNPENLEVICPNCHALTSSYRARNIGNGRKVYYRRVDKGQ